MAAEYVFPSFTPTYHHDVYPAIDPTQPSLSCEGKRIFITGAGLGIGRAIALAFTKAHAHSIALVGRNLVDLEATAALIAALSTNTTKTCICVADIAVQSQVQTAMKASIEHLGGVPDVLVNNAGVFKGAGPLIDVDMDEVWTSYEINVRGGLFVTQAFLRAVRDHASLDEPRVVLNVSSGAAHFPYAPGAMAYQTTKMAFAKVMEGLHHEYPHWQVVSFQPGVVKTERSIEKGRNAPDSLELAGGFAVWVAASLDAKWLAGRYVWANWDVGELLARREEVERIDLLRLCLKGWEHGKSVREIMEATKV